MTNPVHYAFLIDHALGRVQMLVMGTPVQELSIVELRGLTIGDIMSQPICGKRPPNNSDVCKLAPGHDQDRHEGFGGQGWD